MTDKKRDGRRDNGGRRDNTARRPDDGRIDNARRVGKEGGRPPEAARLIRDAHALAQRLRKIRELTAAQRGVLLGELTAALGFVERVGIESAPPQGGCDMKEGVTIMATDLTTAADEIVSKWQEAHDRGDDAMDFNGGRRAAAMQLISLYQRHGRDLTETEALEMLDR